MPKAGKTVLGRQHRVKRLEGPATPGGEAKTGVAQATPAPRAGGKKKAATETVLTDPETLLLWLRGLFTKCFYEKEMRGALPVSLLLLPRGPALTLTTRPASCSASTRLLLPVW